MKIQSQKFKDMMDVCAPIASKKNILFDKHVCLFQLNTNSFKIISSNNEGVIIIEEEIENEQKEQFLVNYENVKNIINESKHKEIDINYQNNKLNMKIGRKSVELLTDDRISMYPEFNIQMNDFKNKDIILSINSNNLLRVLQKCIISCYDGEASSLSIFRSVCLDITDNLKIITSDSKNVFYTDITEDCNIIERNVTNKKKLIPFEFVEILIKILKLIKNENIELIFFSDIKKIGLKYKNLRVIYSLLGEDTYPIGEVHLNSLVEEFSFLIDRKEFLSLLKSFSSLFEENGISLKLNKEYLIVNINDGKNSLNDEVKINDFKSLKNKEWINDNVITTNSLFLKKLLSLLEEDIVEIIIVPHHLKGFNLKIRSKNGGFLIPPVSISSMR